VVEPRELGKVLLRQTGSQAQSAHVRGRVRQKDSCASGHSDGLPGLRPIETLSMDSLSLLFYDARQARSGCRVGLEPRGDGATSSLASTDEKGVTSWKQRYDNGTSAAGLLPA
jgi:hypothetical protein